MATIMLAWELGANLGHVTRMRIMARRLRELGHSCVFAVRDLRSAEALLEPELGRVVQAPLSQSMRGQPRELQRSYSELLRQCGFRDAIDLSGRVRAWRQLAAEYRPAVIYADHSPTALLAARTMDLPSVNVGTGFLLPPQAAPLPAFFPNLAPPDTELLQRDQAVLGVINAALARLGCAPLECLLDLFPRRHGYVLSYRELDHYRCARSETYVGCLDQAHGAAVQWPAARRPRILAYLQRGRSLEAILGVLARSGADVIVRVGGGLDGLRVPNGSRLVIADHAIHLREAAAGSDICLNYASHGFVVDMLLSGKPGLLLPDTTERKLIADRVVEMGAALATTIGESFNLAQGLQRLLDEPSFRIAAQGFARRYRDCDSARTLRAIIDQPLREMGL